MKAATQGTRALEGPGGQVVVQEAQGELRRHHLQRRPRRHQDQQHQQPQPIGLEIGHQPPQQHVPHGLLLDLVTVKKVLLESAMETFFHASARTPQAD